MTLLKYPSKPSNATPFLRMRGSVQPISGRNLAHGRRTPSRRAVAAAQLVLEETRLVAPTIKQAATLAGVSVPYIQQALNLSIEDRSRIAAGEGSLRDATRARELLEAYRAASATQRIGFARAVGPVAFWDHAIA
jgi:hypothetical protein